MVVDASALVETLLRLPAAAAVDRWLLREARVLDAPHLIDVEVALVVRRYAALGDIDDERGRVVLANLTYFPLRRHPHAPFLTRIWELRNNLTAYDAVYVALAETLAVPLLTHDQRLAASAPRHVRVELV